MSGSASPSPTFDGGRRPLWLRSLNALGRLREGLGVPAPPLSAAQLLAAARRRTGLDALGEGNPRAGLQVLAAAFEHEARLSPFGRIAIAALLRRALELRLRIVDRLQRRPAIEQEAIERPVFVVGFPRTGTTLLFNLLAEVEGARPLLGWEAFHSLRPERGADRRIQRHRRALRDLRRLRPELWEAHPVYAEGPEECLPLLVRSFATFTWLFYGDVPSYADWLWAEPEATHDAVYRFHRSQLRLLQHDRPVGGRWLLKSPAHLNALPSLLRAYPDACVVRTHRDLAKVLPSTCSLFAIVQSMFSECVDPAALGGRAVEACRRSLARQLEPFPASLEDRILDLRYADLVADPVGQVERIHAHFDLPWADTSRERLSRWMVAHPRDAHGPHRYTLEGFGLDRAAVDALGATYRERFDVPREA